MWKILKLGEACLVRRGTTITKKHAVEGDVPVIGGGTKPTYFHNEPNRAASCITVSGSGASAGFVNRWDMPIFASDCSTVEPKDETQLPQFVYYYLLSQQQFIYENFRSGAAQPHVYAKDIETLDFPVLPLAEQQRIVAKLDAAFAEIDVAIEAAEETKQNLGAIFEKILDASTQHQTSSVKLKDVCDIQAKLISPKDEPYCNEPHIGAGNIVSMSNELVDVLLAKEEGLISGKFPFGTESVLYSKIRPYLRKVHLPSHTGICSADMYPLIPDANVLDRKYLYHLLLSQTFTDYAMSGAARAGMPKVNRNHLFDFEFQLPALEVQKVIVKKMEAIFYQSSNLQRIHNLKITQIKALKSSILAQELQSEAA
jgi:type I restriction enzyme S subunit